MYAYSFAPALVLVVILELAQCSEEIAEHALTSSAFLVAGSYSCASEMLACYYHLGRVFRLRKARAFLADHTHFGGGAGSSSFRGDFIGDRLLEIFAGDSARGDLASSSRISSVMVYRVNE